MLLLLIASPLVASAAQWEDSFTGSGAAWSGNWNIEEGGHGWGNNELQYYTPGANNNWQTSNRLVIQAKKQSWGGRAYTSSRINSKGKRSFGPYGYMQARIQGPNGKGLWPAFWMLGTNIDSAPWPGCGEIDIMEHVNSDANVLGTIHWANPSGGRWYYTAMNTNAGGFTNWHVYSIWWDADGIDWYVDYNWKGYANILNNVNSTEEFHRPFFIILNLAVGGDWPGPPDGGTPFPATMNIDWVAWN
jgi:beta-glucanase (GH16 family)